MPYFNLCDEILGHLRTDDDDAPLFTEPRRPFALGRSAF